MIFKRKIYNKLVEWKRNSGGRTALLVEGARRIGKSTIVEEFAKNEYAVHLIIDFTVASKAVISLFDDLSDLNRIFLQLQLIYGVSFEARNTLIVFDEVQFCPRARQAIKHLVKDGRYDYIETGSLISIKKNVKDILIPSEEERIEMFPMDYEEFLWAIGKKGTVPLLRKVFDNREPVGIAHRKLMRDFRLYMLVGGMPMAVESYLETNDLKKVDYVKRGILKLYQDDFFKLDETGRITDLFKNIPAQLNKNARRYQVSSVLHNERADSIAPLLSMLVESKTVLIAYHANDPNVGLANNKDPNLFKLFVADIGLFTTLVFLDKDFTENTIYEKLLSDKSNVNLGYLYENVIAQTLAANGNQLYYHTFLNPSSGHNYEVDFLLSRGNKICPIEVKSSSHKAHASLDAFCEKYSNRVGNRYLIYTKDYQKDGATQLLPAYFAQFL
ncbi:MAG: AAA family ATPase [Fibrobacter sp.]|nr:AAA family ATPase [Fibrobacter sp.]